MPDAKQSTQQFALGDIFAAYELGQRLAVARQVYDDVESIYRVVRAIATELTLVDDLTNWQSWFFSKLTPLRVRLVFITGSLYLRRPRQDMAVLLMAAAALQSSLDDVEAALNGLNRLMTEGGDAAAVYRDLRESLRNNADTLSQVSTDCRDAISSIRGHLAKLVKPTLH